MKVKTICLLIIAILCSLFVSTVVCCKKAKIPEPSYWPTNGWESTTPEFQGFNSTKLAEGLNAINEKGIGIHSLMLIRNDKVVLDCYFYPYDGTTYHDIASVTKSIMTTLVAIAADQGKLSLDDTILSFFQDRNIANRDSMKEQITVRHLVSNSSGFRFDENDDAATIKVMTDSDDWVQAALDPPVIHKPGTHFAYYSPGMHLLSAILQQATGMTALEFAEKNLFKPLGINRYYWPSDPQGHTIGYGDLCLYPEDMAKIGFLFLHSGKWEGRQIVSSKWISNATNKQLDTKPEQGEDYGYGWWISRPDEEISYYRAEGRGGQNIVVVPSMNLLLITTGGGYDFDTVAQYVVASIVDLEKPLEPDSAAVKKLNETISLLKRNPESQEVLPLPEIAGKISEKTYLFAPNELSIESLSIDFDNKKEALIELKIASEPFTRNIIVGLDGLWKTSASGKAAVSQGYWKDENNFVWEYSEGPGLNNYTFNLYFENNKAIFEVLMPAPIAGLTIKGTSN